MKTRPATVFGISVGLLLMASTTLSAQESTLDLEAYDQCLLEKLRTAADETPVSKIRQVCLAASQGSTVVS